MRNKTGHHPVKRYSLLEFMALLAGHIPSTYECITLYYGVYSSSYRGKEKRENIGDAKVIVEEKECEGKASSTWACLIQKIFEIGPLLCPKCGKEIKLIAFITDFKEIKNIKAYRRRDSKSATVISHLYIT